MQIVLFIEIYPGIGVKTMFQFQTCFDVQFFWWVTVHQVSSDQELVVSPMGHPPGHVEGVESAER